ncbi:permease [Bacillus sp. KH172YL63]|uniref:permease n=1 Tax=Bacillus sp. KH172YL63 TaxID=2709784 RepID=UPI003FA409BD
MTVLSFCMYFLHPQFKEKDERMKLIREKGMFYSYFVILAFHIVFMMILQFDVIELTAMNLLNILTSLTIMTVFISMVVMSKVY